MRWCKFICFSLVAGVALVVPGCDAFNPAFLDVLGTDVVSPVGPDSSGHVVVAFRNDTVFDERLLQALVNQGLDPELLLTPELRPRIRLRVLVTFINDQQLDIEFNDGSSTIITPLVDSANFPDLTRPEKTNFVGQCDVARVNIVGLPSIFVPIPFSTIRIDPGDENTPPFRVRVTTQEPEFVALEADQVDELGNSILLRNIGIRELPGPAIGPNCGSVISIVVSGTLRVPFVVNEFGEEVPGSLNTDINALEAAPGRFQIDVGVQ